MKKYSILALLIAAIGMLTSCESGGSGKVSSMQFKQMLTLPENVKKDQIGAKVEHGILTVTLPKYTTEEQKKLAQTIVIE